MKASNVTSDEFREWRLGHGMNQASCASRLGISPASVFNYEEGFREDTKRKVEIPLLVAWAMTGIDNNLKPYGEEK